MLLCSVIVMLLFFMFKTAVRRGVKEAMLRLEESVIEIEKDVHEIKYAMKKQEGS